MQWWVLTPWCHKESQTNKPIKSLELGWWISTKSLPSQLKLCIGSFHDQNRQWGKIAMLAGKWLCIAFDISNADPAKSDQMKKSKNSMKPNQYQYKSGSASDV